MTDQTSSVSVSRFRAILSAFSDDQAYSDEAIKLYLDLSAILLNPQRWGEYRDLGQSLFAAHNLVLDKRDEQTSEAGNIPGLSTGVVTSKSVGGASISYDTSSGIELDAGHWNLTTFGRRFIRTARMIGMGGVQLGFEDALQRGPAFGTGWPGVIRPLLP